MRLTRRGALVLGGLGVAAVGGLGAGVHALGGPAKAVEAVRQATGDPPTPSVSPTCVAAADLPVHRTLGGAPLIYDATGDPADFRLEATFHTALEAWLPKHAAESGLGMPAQIWTLGSWIEGDPSGTGAASDGTVDSADGCSSWHNAGRAFDLTRLLDAAGEVVVSCRYDLWSKLPDEQMVAHRVRYWRTAAGLHRDFDSVLTYLFNGLHHNHIHVDNGRVDTSGTGPSGSQFRTRSQVQVQAVQAMCTYVWGQALDLTGSWDAATRETTARVLDEAKIGGNLTDGQEQWHGFLTATLRRGT